MWLIVGLFAFPSVFGMAQSGIIPQAAQQHLVPPKPLLILREPRDLKNSCGTTRLTQWSVHFKKKTLSSLRTRDFVDEFCEPHAPENLPTNATALFWGRDGKVIWTRRLSIQPHFYYDRLDPKKKLDGGVIRLEKSEIQIKVPMNSETSSWTWLQLLFDDGLSLGPVMVRPSEVR